MAPVCGAGTVPALQLRSDRNRYDVSPYAEILEDKDRKWCIDDVATPPLAEAFKPVGSKTLNLGLSDSAFWIRLTIQAETVPGDNSPPGEWLLDVNWPLTLFTRFFVRTSAGASGSDLGGWVTEEGGTPVDSVAGSSGQKLPFFTLPLESEEPVTVYLRVEGEGGIILPLMLYRNNAYLSRSLRIKGWCSVNYGILIAMAVFNLFL